LRMIEDTNYVQCGKTLGVSDNAVRKHLKSVTSTPHQFAAQPA
jgi:predicted ArsR family transcriptional regulator